MFSFKIKKEFNIECSSSQQRSWKVYFIMFMILQTCAVPLVLNSAAFDRDRLNLKWLLSVLPAMQRFLAILTLSAGGRQPILSIASRRAGQATPSMKFFVSLGYFLKELFGSRQLSSLWGDQSHPVAGLALRGRHPRLS